MSIKLKLTGDDNEYSQQDQFNEYDSLKPSQINDNIANFEFDDYDDDDDNLSDNNSTKQVKITINDNDSYKSTTSTYDESNDYPQPLFTNPLAALKFSKSICSDDNLFNYTPIPRYNYDEEKQSHEMYNVSTTSNTNKYADRENNSNLVKPERVSSEINKKVIINVSGIRYETYYETLKTIMDSRLANLSKTNSDYDPIRNEYFFDRHPGAFLAILNYFRTGKLHAPLDLCANLFYEELNYWGINEYLIEPCCWTHYEKLRTVIVKESERLEGFPVVNDDSNWKSVQQSAYNIDYEYEVNNNNANCIKRCFNCCYSFTKRIRPKVQAFFEDRQSSVAANIFFWISVIILFISLINFVLETSSYFRIPYEIASNLSIPRSEREELTQPHEILKNIERFCNAFFTVEMVFKFLSSPNKLKFLHSPYNLCEFLSILPFFFPIESKEAPKTWAVKMHNYLEVFYILRIFRIFVLVPKYSGLRVLILTMKTSVGELFLYSLLLLMTVMLFASFAFYAEQIYEGEKNQFESILIGLWWAIVTMTTLGYGDIVPITPLGRVVGAGCALCGLVFLALPIPVIVNNFTTFYAQAKAHKKLESFIPLKKKAINRAIFQQFQNIQGLPQSVTQVTGLDHFGKDSYLSPNYTRNINVSDKFEIETLNNSATLSIGAKKKKSRGCIHLKRHHTMHPNLNVERPSANKDWDKCKRKSVRRNALLGNHCQLLGPQMQSGLDFYKIAAE